MTLMIPCAAIVLAACQANILKSRVTSLALAFAPVVKLAPILLLVRCLFASCAHQVLTLQVHVPHRAAFAKMETIRLDQARQAALHVNRESINPTLTTIAPSAAKGPTRARRERHTAVTVKPGSTRRVLAFRTRRNAPVVLQTSINLSRADQVAFIVRKERILMILAARQLLAVNHVKPGIYLVQRLTSSVDLVPFGMKARAYHLSVHGEQPHGKLVCVLLVKLANTSCLIQ